MEARAVQVPRETSQMIPEEVLEQINSRGHP